ncbi:MAG: hypothetical protein ABIF12_03105 [bacterium]
MEKSIEKFKTFQQALNTLNDAIEIYNSESQEKYAPHSAKF